METCKSEELPILLVVFVDLLQGVFGAGLQKVGLIHPRSHAKDITRDVLRLAYQ